jgi:Fe-S-cluster containining protein
MSKAYRQHLRSTVNGGARVPHRVKVSSGTPRLAAPIDFAKQDAARERGVFISWDKKVTQPPDSSSKKSLRRVRLVGEEEVRRAPSVDGGEGEKGDAQENPYWLVDEAEHPDPTKGCIRRGLCCKSNPGSFAPGEAEGAAALLGLTPDAFVKKYLIIDWVEFEGAAVEVFAPVKVGRDNQPMYETARRVDKLYRFLRGACIFFDGQGCGIYDARPLECQRYICTNAPAQNLSPKTLARMWRDGITEEEARREGDVGD